MSRGRSLPYRPPSREATAAERWVLLQAFDETGARASAGEADGERFRAAARLGQVERIWARRQARSIFPAPAGTDGLFAKAYRRAHARALLFEAIAERLTAAARACGCEPIFLKGFALQVAEVTAPGSRPYADLDVLVPRAVAPELKRRLEELGYRAGPGRGNEHHLPVLYPPLGGAVEIHFVLRGIRLGRSGWATAGELDRAGLLRRIDAPASPTVLAPGAQAVHLVTHGLAHHALRPRSYPLLRLVGDLHDLLDEGDWPELRRRTVELGGGLVGTAELAALEELCLALASGQTPGAGSPGGALLTHVLAAAVDERYVRRLRARNRWARLRAAVGERRLITYLETKLLDAATRLLPRPTRQ